jgi:integrase/recombinase XerD
MLHLYRRHRVSCPHKSQAYRRCDCPIYVKGTLGDTHVRQSMDQTSWSAAQKTIGQWIEAGGVGVTKQTSMPVSDAIAAFLADLDGRGLAIGTTRKYRTLLERKLLPWTRAHGRPLLSTLTLDSLSQFRGTWAEAPLAKQKSQERLKSFFAWCRARGWVATNQATDLSAVKVTHDPTLPYTPEEMGRILAAVDRYPAFNTQGYDNRARVKAFVLALRWTGLRMRDVVTLRRDAVVDGRIFLYTQKTGTPVRVPVPQAVIDALAAVGGTGTYYFWTGRGTAENATSAWRRSLRVLFELAIVSGAHAHRFRDTFAVELLLGGAELIDVSILLGHSSIKVTEKHYSPWVSARQNRLESAVRGTWSDAPTGSAAPPTTDAPAA